MAERRRGDSILLGAALAAAACFGAGLAGFWIGSNSNSGRCPSSIGGRSRSRSRSRSGSRSRTVSPKPPCRSQAAVVDETSTLLSSLRDKPLPKSGAPMEDPCRSVANPIVERVIERMHQHHHHHHHQPGGDEDDVAVTPVVVGIAGGTGSGKTSLARAVFESLGEENVTYICHDSYYRDLTHLPVEERAKTNFDHPDSLETDLLVRHLRELKSGACVNVPRYDFTIHSRKAEVTPTDPRKVIIVEGILIFSDENLRNEMDIKIFVDTDADIRVLRRISRDVAERGRTVNSVIDQYLMSVRPMHEQFVEPARTRCDLIVPVGLNQIALDLIVSRLRFIVGQ